MIDNKLGAGARLGCTAAGHAMGEGDVQMRKRTAILTMAVGAGLALTAKRVIVPRSKMRRHQVDHLYGVDDPEFVRCMGTILPPAYVGGNRIRTLSNGRETFPAMLEAIRQAEKTITFEVFIYLHGQIGHRFAEALAGRARAGLQVHVLLDWLGSALINPESLALMYEAGVEVRRFHRPPWYSLQAANIRTHRKILVVDGKVGFVGGINIADSWAGDAADWHHWRDVHYQIEGPAVAQLQQAYMDNWLKTHNRVLHGAHYFPALEPAGESLAQVFPAAPVEGSTSVRLVYAMAIGAAVRSIKIATTYFVPDRLLIESLEDARRRGVDVEIIVPSKHIDLPLVRCASRALWGGLLQAGVKIYEYQPAMYHCKAMIVDERWVSVGSTNIDNRSFSLNDEVNLNVYDARFAAEQIEWFERDKQHARQVTLDAWHRRGALTKLVDNAAAIFRAQL